jgi:ERCC4-type nuclease
VAAHFRVETGSVDVACAHGEIVVDTRERRDIDSELTSLGIHVRRERLLIGDYVAGHDAIVERKTVSDLHRCIVNGRLWLQAGALKSTSRWPYLIVEDRALDAGPLGVKQVRGALLNLMERGVRILMTDGVSDTVCWLALLATHDRSSRRVWRPHRIPVRLSGPESLLTAIPGLSPALASVLLKRFGSVHGIANARRDQLLDVPGIGLRRAETIKNVLTT